MVRSVHTAAAPAAPPPAVVAPLRGASFRVLPAHARSRRLRFAERQRIIVRNPLPLGTNGYSTSWGTNAHGELSACPPGRG
ncbi:hypothetical protein SAMN05421803_101676 [Nocardiopsis flavescens]|uniref:Uncharacterized protein n=1 Tax=Nocardiopsis flavescens TaxID=758803 RepID=A0A1M6CE45_9ACTN|nr:hypothetical protein [Nocardiopsis flavescens]SHI59277.1 hypothetical protein SAMN05421803_101676 [Nocardiopsis flavescens]